VLGQPDLLAAAGSQLEVGNLVRGTAIEVHKDLYLFMRMECFRT
jgi:hypothetical protein